jgi:hypothetical protein
MADMTMEELQAKAEAKRKDAERERMTTTISEDEAFRVRQMACSDCGEAFQQIQTPSGQWRPAEHCRPKPDIAPPTEPTGYNGDTLADLHAAGVNVYKYRDATLRSFDAEHDEAAYNSVCAWIDAWSAGVGKRFAPRDWMYLYGSGSERKGRDVTIGRLGNGKTHLAIAAARELIETDQLHPGRFLFRTAETILLESEATFRSNSEDSEKRLLSHYERPDLLIIDDFGVRHDPSPHAVRLFDELTKRREARGTIWTSNLSIKVVAGANETMRRIADRIAGECGDGARYVQQFAGPSRRRERSRKTAA